MHSGRKILNFFPLFLLNKVVNRFKVRTMGSEEGTDNFFGPKIVFEDEILKCIAMAGLIFLYLSSFFHVQIWIVIFPCSYMN